LDRFLDLPNGPAATPARTVTAWPRGRTSSPCGDRGAPGVSAPGSAPAVRSSLHMGAVLLLVGLLLGILIGAAIGYLFARGRLAAVRGARPGDGARATETAR